MAQGRRQRKTSWSCPGRSRRRFRDVGPRLVGGTGGQSWEETEEKEISEWTHIKLGPDTEPSQDESSGEPPPGASEAVTLSERFVSLFTAEEMRVCVDLCVKGVPRDVVLYLIISGGGAEAPDSARAPDSALRDQEAPGGGADADEPGGAAARPGGPGGRGRSSTAVPVRAYPGQPQAGVLQPLPKDPLRHMREARVATAATCDRHHSSNSATAGTSVAPARLC